MGAEEPTWPTRGGLAMVVSEEDVRSSELVLRVARRGTAVPLPVLECRRVSQADGPV